MQKFVILRIMSKFAVTFAIFLVSVMPTLGQSDDHNEEIIANTLGHLSKMTTPADSLLPMANLFDLYSSSGQMLKATEMARQSYATALRAGDNAAALAMLRMLANIYREDIAYLKQLETEALKFEPNADSKETVAFIRLKMNYYFVNKAPDDSLQAHFQENLAKLATDHTNDIYDRLVVLNAICQNLAKETSGELLVEYFDRLDALADSLPPSNVALRSDYLVAAAIAYSRAGYSRKAIQADEKLLAVTDRLENYYTSVGRPHRNHDASRYVIYTRLLGNYKDLTPQEMERYYKGAMKMVMQNRRAAITYGRNPLPDIYKAMYDKDYARAVPLLKDAVANPNNVSRQRQMLRMLLTAAEAIGDEQTAIETYRQYTEVLEKHIEDRLRERYRELQIVYDTNALRHDYDTLQAQKLKSDSTFRTVIFWICVLSIIGLLVLVFFLVRQYRHSRQLAENLAERNDVLKKESEALKAAQEELAASRDQALKANQFKTDFIKSMAKEIATPLEAITEHVHLIVDCTEAKEKSYLVKYAEYVELNAAYLQAVVNDVLHLSELDSNTVSLRRELVDLRKIAELAAAMVRPQLHDGVEIVFDDDNSVNPDTFTDPRRIQQIFLHLLENAAKFTTKGRIYLECHISDDGQSIHIAISDTGIGIPAKYRDHIFERFVRLHPEIQGAGLGLPISRLLARLLGGDLFLDTTYSRGARFILTIPHKLQ